MKTYSDHIFEKQLDEYINNDIVEINEGIFDWFKKMGKKFMNWIQGKKYDEDTDWSVTDKNKNINIKDAKYVYDIINKNKTLQEKFKTTYKLLADSDVVKCSAIMSVNADKAPTMIILFTENPEVFEPILKKTKFKKHVEALMKDYKIAKNEKWAMVFCTEYADNKIDDKNNIKLAKKYMYNTFKNVDKIWIYASNKDSANFNFMKSLNLQPELEDDKYEKYITDQMHAIQPEMLSK